VASLGTTEDADARAPSVLTVILLCIGAWDLDAARHSTGRCYRPQGTGFSLGWYGGQNRTEQNSPHPANMSHGFAHSSVRNHENCRFSHPTTLVGSDRKNRDFHDFSCFAAASADRRRAERLLLAFMLEHLRSLNEQACGARVDPPTLRSKTPRTFCLAVFCNSPADMGHAFHSLSHVMDHAFITTSAPHGTCFSQHVP